MNSRPIAARLNQVSFRYNEAEAPLTKIDFTLHRGECVLLTGPSGSGKSTLIRLFNGLIPHFYEGQLTGDMELFGRSAAGMESWEFSRIAGSIFQDSRSQFFNAVVRDEIAFGGENLGMEPEEIRSRLDRLAGRLGIGGRLEANVQTLSGGEKQKVAFAAASLPGPELYVLDEPSANLDRSASLQLSRLLAELKQDGRTLLIAEHRLHDLLPIADRIVYMEEGSIRAEWTPQQLLSLSAGELEQFGLRSPRLELDPAGVEPIAETEFGVERPDRLTAVNLGISSPGGRRSARNMLENVGLVLRPGEITALTGPNGAGKSTLAKTLSGLIREREGSVSLSGERLRASKRLGRVGFVMQDSECQLFADSVRGELLLTREKDPQAPELAERLLRELGLWELRERHPLALSGGQKQRLALAAGIMGRPDVLVLDEPTSGLDGRNMRHVIRLLRDIAAGGTAILVITHDFEWMQAACDRLVVVRDRGLHTYLRPDSASFRRALTEAVIRS
ncbi:MULTISPECIES: ABC transporter ATP-binding protein [Saccharibacillus]|uniref:ABC transporter ATP-binding protein n=1 Tax=Saccharibacillus TaxID=456492 RepID=UPI00123B6EF5|nr:energy-coupling factor ABC transporter ATP-binding protein [Saccharibacillus sp. WB 17]MWJ32015.1 ATP-binding cassette domain-containing protein [Saccharibacillus sp. WB 17]